MNDNKQSPRSAKRVLNEEGGVLEDALEDVFDEAIEEVMGSLFRVGRMWALHGLRVAELALQTSAATLRVTADAMGQGSSHQSDRVDAE